MKVHYLKPESERWPACGIILPVATTRDIENVTCGHCRNRLWLTPLMGQKAARVTCSHGEANVDGRRIRLDDATIERLKAASCAT